MHNLRQIALEEIVVPNGLPLTATAWDTSNNSIICAFGPTTTESVIELKRKRARSNAADDNEIVSQYETITSWDAPCPLPELECDEVLLLQYFPDTTSACLVMAGGDLVIVRENPALDQEKIEIIGSVDIGLAAAAWSPDEELLVLVTRAETLVLMSRDFEPVTEATLSPGDVTASTHVSVGWGKKETQFQGKRAKALQDPTLPDSMDVGKLSPLDDRKVSLSWRGDGAYFATNSIVQGERRVVRVFTREARLESVSEPVDGLEGALTWRPLGNLLAGIRRCEDKIDVVFFERNGLRHGKFPLRLSKGEMKDWGSSTALSWNTTSTVLAVSFKDRVQFWTMGNYHYYLKQEVGTNQTVPADHAVKVQWHAEQPLRCAISSRTLLLDLEYALMTCRGSTSWPHDHGSIAVIDGKLLKLTPLRYANVPPPMSFCEIEARNNIIDCALSRSSQYLAILTGLMVEVYKWHDSVTGTENNSRENSSHENDYRDRKRRLGPILTLQCRYLLNKGEDQVKKRYTQIKLLGEDDIFIIASPQGKLWQSSLLRWKHKDLIPPPDDGIDIPLKCKTVVTDVTHESLWVQGGGMTVAATGDLAAQQFSGDEQNTEIVRLHPTGCLCKVSMSKGGDLLADSRILARDCTSFLVTEQHLIFTTSNHYLKFVHLSDKVEQLQVPPDTPASDERCRNIERGAVLITVIPSTYAVVLQMPRGNLETIFPRALVVAGIRRHLLDADYKKAFLACQCHQVDLNLLHDFNPNVFMENVELFIEQVKKPTRVDEFLSKLKEENVSQTMYGDTLMASKAQAVATENRAVLSSTPFEVSPDSKVNRICNAFFSTIQRKDPTRYQNLITAHVSKRPPDFFSALSLISDIRQNDPATGEKAIAHLVFLSDAARLYDVALSTYDLELTVSVAENAQMDPREYLPFLEELHTMGPLQRRYEIDHYLRNYDKALKWLHAQAKHAEVEAYTVEHGLYIDAINLYKYSPTQLNTLISRYAEYLRSQSRYLDAAIAFESLGDHKSAYLAYARAHHWREALTCADLVPLETEQLRLLARSLATTLTNETKDYRSAATIYVDYLQEITTGSRLLCKGSYFSEASRLLVLHKAADQIPEVVDAGLGEKVGEITELLADCKAQLNAQVPRVRDLRIRKDEDSLAFFGGDPSMANGEGDISDNISLAPTNTSTAGGQSLFTRYGSKNSKFGGTMASNMSYKTSKTQRREERKRARGKKGSVYEEEYLIASIARLIERLNGVQEEARRLIEGLLRRGMRQRAQVVEDNMVELSTLCLRAKEEIWPVEKRDTSDSNEKALDSVYEGRPRGGDGVLWDSKMESQERKEAPTVKEWKTVGLLAR